MVSLDGRIVGVEAIRVGVDFIVRVANEAVSQSLIATNAKVILGLHNSLIKYNEHDQCARAREARMIIYHQTSGVGKGKR